MKIALLTTMLLSSLLSIPVAEEPVLTYDPYATSNLSAAHFDKLLEGSALEGCGEYFEAVEDEYGVNGLFALSVCNLESGLGKYQANTNNFFGFYYQTGFMQFQTAEEGIRYFGKLISSSIYSGKNIDQIASVYCPGNPNWAPDVRWLMEYHFDRLVTEQKTTTGGTYYGVLQNTNASCGNSGCAFCSDRLGRFAEHRSKTLSRRLDAFLGCPMLRTGVEVGVVKE